jgi:hypothetical protein
MPIHAKPPPLRTTRAPSLAMELRLHLEPNVLRPLPRHTHQKVKLQQREGSVIARQPRKRKTSSTSVEGTRLFKRSLIRSWQLRRRRARGPALTHLQLPLVQRGVDCHGKPTTTPDQLYCPRRKRNHEPRMSSSKHDSVPRGAPCSPLRDTGHPRTWGP